MKMYERYNKEGKAMYAFEIKKILEYFDIFFPQIENYFFSLDINLSIPLSKPIDKLDDSGISDISRGGQYIRYLHARSTFVYFYYFILYTFKHLGNVCSIPHISQRQTVTMIPATLSPLVMSLPRRVVTFI